MRYSQVSLALLAIFMLFTSFSFAFGSVFVDNSTYYGVCSYQRGTTSITGGAGREIIAYTYNESFADGATYIANTTETASAAETSTCGYRIVSNIYVNQTTDPTNFSYRYYNSSITVYQQIPIVENVVSSLDLSLTTNLTAQHYFDSTTCQGGGTGYGLAAIKVSGSNPVAVSTASADITFNLPTQTITWIDVYPQLTTQGSLKKNTIKVDSNQTSSTYQGYSYRGYGNGEINFCMGSRVVLEAINGTSGTPKALLERISLSSYDALTPDALPYLVQIVRAPEPSNYGIFFRV